MFEKKAQTITINYLPSGTAWLHRLIRYFEKQGCYQLWSRTRPNVKDGLTLLTQHINSPSFQPPERAFRRRLMSERCHVHRTASKGKGESMSQPSKGCRALSSHHGGGRAQSVACTRRRITPALWAGPPSIITVPQQVKDPFRSGSRFGILGATYFIIIFQIHISTTCGRPENTPRFMN